MLLITQVEQRSKVAAAGVEVMLRLDSSRAVCDCIAALVNGDLTAPAAPTSGHGTGAVEHLLPLQPPASAAPDMVQFSFPALQLGPECRAHYEIWEFC